MAVETSSTAKDGWIQKSPKNLIVKIQQAKQVGLDSGKSKHLTLRKLYSAGPIVVGML